MEENKQHEGEGDTEGSANEITMVETVTTYHVHKCSLAYGTRKSEYFARLFKSANAGVFNESNSRMSRIELEPLAASAFPAFLDYIYAPENPLKISTNAATALHSLGEYFEIRHLRWDARQFCLQDLSLTNLDTYYEHAMVFQNESVQDVLARFVGQNLLKIAPTSGIVKIADPAFWVKALNAARKSEPQHEDFLDAPRSLHWSKLMAEIGTLNVETMDKAVFHVLTNACNMPDVHVEAALVLCDLDDGLRNRCPENHNPAEETPQPRPLQQRCGAALALKWDEFGSTEDKARMLGRRQSSFLAGLLLNSLEKAKAALTAKEMALEKYSQELEKCRAAIRRSEKECRVMKINNNSLQQSSLEVRRETLKMSQIIKKMVPLPINATYDFQTTRIDAERLRGSFPEELKNYYPKLAASNEFKAVFGSDPTKKHLVFYYDEGS